MVDSKIRFIVAFALGLSLICGPASAADWLYNFGGNSLDHWKSKLADVQSGTSNAIVAMIGDSLTQGFPWSRAQSYISATVSTLNASEAAAEGDSFFGDANTSGEGVSYSTYDSRITMGAGWGVFTGASNITFGGHLFSSNGALTALSFADGVQNDRYDIYYLQNSDFTVNVDGGSSLETISSLGLDTPAKITVSTSLGTHTLNIVPSSASPVYIIGVHGYNSAAKKVAVFGAGSGGATASAWVDQGKPWATYATIPVIAPDLSIIMLGTNDWNTGVSASSYKSSTQTLIDRCKVSGDVILIVPTPTSITRTSIEVQNVYRQVLYQLADDNNIPLIDLWMAPRWGAFGASANADGCYYDTVHQNATCYAAMGKLIAQAIQ